MPAYLKQHVDFIGGISRFTEPAQAIDYESERRLKEESQEATEATGTGAGSTEGHHVHYHNKHHHSHKGHHKHLTPEQRKAKKTRKAAKKAEKEKQEHQFRRHAAKYRHQLYVEQQKKKAALPTPAPTLAPTLAPTIDYKLLMPHDIKVVIIAHSPIQT